MRPNGVVTITTWSVLSLVVFLSLAAGDARRRLRREAAARGLDVEPAGVRFAWGTVVFEDVRVTGRASGRFDELRVPVGNDQRLDAHGGRIEAKGDLSVIVGRRLELHDVELVRAE